jgi:cell division protein FtsW
MIISRSDSGPVARWWFTVDRLMMSTVFLLMAIGVLVSMAASPSVADRLDLDTLHFVRSQLFYIAIAVPLMLVISIFPIAWLRRIAVLGFIVSIGLMIGAIFFGQEIKGAHRWINVGFTSLQPSELAKPFFVVVASWFLAERIRRPDMPAHFTAYGVAVLILLVLLLQPDFGQAILVACTFGGMLLISGLPWVFILGLAGLAVAGVSVAYVALPHVASRIDRFLAPEKGDTFQMDTAMEAFRNGGPMGTGPGGGASKLVLPDAHTDFAFAVIGEEYGMFACMVLVMIIGFIVVRVLMRARAEPEPFAALGLFGLGTMFGIQAFINMGVNSALLPAKGMTLPFISYGGSSLLGTSILMGFVLGLGRKQQQHAITLPGLKGAATPA